MISTAALGVQVARGLIGQQHGGLGDDGARNGHALLLPAREFGRGVVLPAPRPTASSACGRLAPQRRRCPGTAGQFHVLLAEVRASRLKPWNTKPKSGAAAARARRARATHMHAWNR